MNLKEAFRYQNKLGALMTDAEMILEREPNITSVKNTHLRKKVFESAENETTVDEPITEFAGNITELARFVVHLMQEREKLSKAIREAKQKLPIDMDSEVSLNAKRQEIVRVYKRMLEVRNKEVLVSGGGTGYRFNQEGNQVTYRYDIQRVTTINFDRKIVRNIAAEMTRKADEVSAELDRCLVNSTVDYAPTFGVNDSFAEVFKAYLGGQADE